MTRNTEPSSSPLAVVLVMIVIPSLFAGSEITRLLLLQLLLPMLLLLLLRRLHRRHTHIY